MKLNGAIHFLVAVFALHGLPVVTAKTKATSLESELDSELGLQLPGYPSAAIQLKYDELVRLVDWKSVESDIEKVLTNSQDWWPADYGNYGGLFIRLAWHAAGTYRKSDGRGGGEGGAMRFDPERCWADNGNLDKARRLLEPVKTKYGDGLSWGDLFILAGNVAIKSMGGPVLGFCAGRMDALDNSQTIALGPSPEQERFAKCEVQGACKFPLGPNTVGLIYVNPAGPMGKPDPQAAAETIREVFGSMDWEGRELVALNGGGHTFGKAHGASKPSGEAPTCPFMGTNYSKGVNAVTSGFEGPWTSAPTVWGNDFFTNLLNFDWEVHTGPGGNPQWRVKGGLGPKAPSADLKGAQDIMMLTTDIALKVDPEYQKYVKEFAANKTAFEEAFAQAWYKLVTRDMGSAARCIGPNVPPPQPFQQALPAPPSKVPNMRRVTRQLKRLMRKSSNVEEYVRLAYQCASSFRATDNTGGCDGARVRFHLDWPINAGLGDTLDTLKPVKDRFNGLSWADLIVLAGNVAAEQLGSPSLPFCAGRTDATSGWMNLDYKIDRAPASVDDVIELYQRRGQTDREFVALTFMTYGSSDKLKEAIAASSMDAPLLALRNNVAVKKWADYYTSTGSGDYAADFATAWTRLMNADRFDGPVRRRACVRSKRWWEF